MSGNWRSGFAALAVAAPAPLLAVEQAPPPSPPPIIQIGSAYFAKQLCSCLFVVGRTELSCRAEFKPQIDAFKITIDRSRLPRSATVTTNLGPATALASYAPRFGCVLVK